MSCKLLDRIYLILISALVIPRVEGPNHGVYAQTNTSNIKYDISRSSKQVSRCKLNGSMYLE
jgi:hypothetical protein